MAPGTNIGAVTPVRMGGAPFLPGGKPEQQKNGQDKAKAAEPADTESRKAIKRCGRLYPQPRRSQWPQRRLGRRGRGTAASLQASEALKLHVIDVTAEDVPDLLRKIDGRVTLAGKPERLATAGIEAVMVAPDWRASWR